MLWSNLQLSCIAPHMNFLHAHFIYLVIRLSSVPLNLLDFVSGLKNFVFDTLLVRDSVRVGVASVLVVSLLLLATVRCTALVLFGLFNLLFSLSLSYWLFCSVLGAQRFPFLNLVAVLLLLG